MDFDVIDEENKKINNDNEWHRQLKKHLISGKAMIGQKAVRNSRPIKSNLIKSNKQANAIRR